MKSCRLGWHCCRRREGGEREERRFSVAGVPVLLTPGCFGGLRFALPAGLWAVSIRLRVRGELLGD
jgi:hypothetical protein